MSTPPRVGIVGTGHIAMREHIPGIRDAGGQVVALADKAAGVAEKVAAAHGIQFSHTDYRALVNDPQIDVVAICTPPEVHCEIALAAIAAGKHVFMEKPPTTGAHEIRAVAEAARQARRILLAGSHHPYRENVTWLRDHIAAGRLGEVYAVDCFKLRRDNAPPDRPDAVKPHGITSGSTVHRIDVALYLLGLPRVSSVVARTYGHFMRQADERAGIPCTGLGHDSLIATLHLANGGTITLRDMLAAHMEEPNFMQCWFGDLTVFGSHAGARLHPLTLFQNQTDGSQRITVPPVSNDLHQGHAPAYRHLFACMREGRIPADSPARAVAVMEVIDAIYASAAAAGRQVMLPTD